MNRSIVCLAAGFRPAQPLLLPLALLFMALIAIMCTAIGTAVDSVLEDGTVNLACPAGLHWLAEMGNRVE